MSRHPAPRDIEVIRAFPIIRSGFVRVVLGDFFLREFFAAVVVIVVVVLMQHVDQRFACGT